MEKVKCLTHRLILLLIGASFALPNAAVEPTPRLGRLLGLGLGLLVNADKSKSSILRGSKKEMVSIRLHGMDCISS